MPVDVNPAHSPFAQLLQLAPVLLLLFISLFSFPSETERPFSLYRSDKYMSARQTTVEQVRQAAHTHG